MDCLICLAPCEDHATKCRNDHPMHINCFRSMVFQMGKINCPYCASHVPAIRTIKFEKPSRLKRTVIKLEHWIYALVLLPNYLFRYRACWNINTKLLYIRLKFDNIAPLQNEIREFRSTMADRILNILPSVLYGFEMITRTTPLTKLDGLKLVLTIGYWFNR
jgi:hypothetical protein